MSEEIVIYFKQLDGSTTALSINTFDRISDIIEKLINLKGIDGTLKLNYKGTLLDPGKRFVEYNVQHNDNIHMIVGLKPKPKQKEKSSIEYICCCIRKKKKVLDKED